MWTIRPAQVQELRRSALADFEDAMVKHLHGFNPGLAKALGDDGLRVVIRFGIDRARTHRWTRRCCVQFFIELVTILGAEFDTDPQYPWAAAILADASIDDQTERADELHARVMQYWETAIGDGGAIARAALQRLRQIRPESIDEVSPNDPGFQKSMLDRLRSVYPEKLAAIGVPAATELIRRAQVEARVQSVTSDAGLAVLIGLMFTLGHGVTRDPHMPWVASTLANPTIPDPNKRVERLYARSMAYLDAVIHGGA